MFIDSVMIPGQIISDTCLHYTPSNSVQGLIKHSLRINADPSIWKNFNSRKFSFSNRVSTASTVISQFFVGTSALMACIKAAKSFPTVL